MIRLIMREGYDLITFVIIILKVRPTIRESKQHIISSVQVTRVTSLHFLDSKIKLLSKFKLWSKIKLL